VHTYPLRMRYGVHRPYTFGVHDYGTVNSHAAGAIKAFGNLRHGHLDEIAIRPHVQFHIVLRCLHPVDIICVHKFVPEAPRTAIRLRYVGWLAIQWRDIDFQKWALNIRKSIWQQHLGPVKTEESEKTMLPG
jgi:hypothetical protein